MEKIKPGMLYISVDGDSIGAKVGKAVLANDVEELHKVSARIDAAQDYIEHWCEQVNGIKISGGGDEATMSIPAECKEKLKELRSGIEKSFGYTISVGVGRNLSEAGTALLVAKLRGKDRIVWFNKKIKEDIKKAKRRVREKRASQEEYKLAEAYLTKADSMLCDLHKKENHKKHVHVLHKAEGEYGLYGAPDLKPGEKYHLASHSPTTGNLHYKGTVGSKKGLRSAADKRDLKHGAVMRHVVTVVPAHTAAPMVKYEEGFHAPHTEQGIDDPCPYCADNEDNRTDDCAYCQDLDAEENADGTAGMHDCEMCRDYDASLQNTGGIDDCPYCQTENIPEIMANPQEEPSHICNCPNCPDKDQTALAVQDMGAERPDDCPECQEMYGQAIEEQPDQTGQVDPSLQGHETAEEVLDLLDQEPGTGDQTPQQEAQKIDNTELPQGDQMRENVSVKENFGPAQKNDISDSEKDFAQQDQKDEPDMGEVLQSGLDDHASDQKKQEVLNMVGQTLAGFKANKTSLEQSKEQNVGLYQSTIQMLKAMIELCKLLGLEPRTTPSSESQPQEMPVQAPKAAPSEGAAEAPKALS
jgi:hypothetical protein